YNVYTFEDRKRYFYFLKEKLMKPRQAAIAANVNYDTALKWKQTYEDDPERNIPVKKTDKTIYRIVSQLNEAHESHLINFFDEDSTATIQDTVEDLTAKFADLDIKKSRVAEFMKEECNLSIKVLSQHPVARNKEETLEKRANWFGFDINMRRSRGWSPHGSKSMTETSSTKATSHSVLGAISAIGVMNMKL
ncbi:hypothetical protein F4703DRAFT_1723095, partial [Phycomyces blakesleeanus]